MKTHLFVVGSLVIAAMSATDARSQDMRASPGHTVYTIDPNGGDDSNPPGKPWKTFHPLRNMTLSAGDDVEIHPGTHLETLDLKGEGTTEAPIRIHFLSGVHLLQLDHPTTAIIFSSNSMDTEAPKPVGIYLHGMKHVRLSGNDPDKTLILYGKRVVQIYHDHTEDVEWYGISFDLKRPVMSELRVLDVHDNEATIQIAEGSDYTIEKNRLRWVGDCGGMYWNSLDLSTGLMKRIGSANVLEGATATALTGRKVHLTFRGTPGILPNYQYINYWAGRDRLGVFNDRCKDMTIRNCRFHALCGMGFLSQFTENLTYDHLTVSPPAGSIRTCAAVVDILHCSNCKGLLRIESCNLSGMQDDALNVHGTYLGVTGKPAANQLELTYMHRQTYGFAPCAPGDDLEVINPGDLRPYPDNPIRKVIQVERKSPKVWVVTLDGAAPFFHPKDVIDNITWHPDVIARNNHISVDCVRGFLLTSRGKMVVEGNTFDHCCMPAILVSSDAHDNYESGGVKDLLITHNRFIGSGIDIHPGCGSLNKDAPVHENIRIIDNYFDHADIGASRTRNIRVTGNRSLSGKINISLDPHTCSETTECNNDVAGSE